MLAVCCFVLNCCRHRHDHHTRVVCNLAVGFVTPPIGQNLFVAAAIADQRPERIALSSAPFLAAMLLLILLVTFLPELSLFLPGLM